MGATVGGNVVVEAQRSSARHTPRDPSADEARSEIASIVDLRKTLSSRLEYMVKYLEMLKGSTIGYSADVFQSVLEKVKATQTWQKQILMGAALDAKIKELDDFMAAAPRSMMPGSS